MIFVTVGTTAFDSLIKSVDEISNQIKEEIICQIADGKYIPEHCEYFRFKPSLEKEFKNADLVICHGGAGTIFNLIKLNKKVISVPNLERKDKHQTDLIDALSEGNYIISCYELSKLKTKILDSKKISLKIYENPECRIAEEIVKFIGE
ncbi:MAG: PssE/Cps14G family polysaccharide biosynthesis glycosyltransferase [Syntrophales bacterium]